MNGDGEVNSDDRSVVFDADGKTVGITVGEALENIVGLAHYDEDESPTASLNGLQVEGSYSTRMVDGNRVLWRIRGIAKEDGNPLRQWEILTPDGIAPREGNVREKVIAPENGITLANVQDLDDDLNPPGLLNYRSLAINQVVPVGQERLYVLAGRAGWRSWPGSCATGRCTRREWSASSRRSSVAIKRL